LPARSASSRYRAARLRYRPKLARCDTRNTDAIRPGAWTLIYWTMVSSILWYRSADNRAVRIPWYHELAWRNTREAVAVPAVCWGGGRTSPEPR
jgi:hypothetical protein